MSHDPEQLIVITGGPGAGKTTLIDKLRRAGYAATTEAARAVIQDQVAIGGPAVPWRDPALFAEHIMSWELRSYREAASWPGPVFFDRSLVELACHYRRRGQPVPDHVQTAATMLRFRRQVFIAPPWPEIYTQDAERTQSLAEAEEVYRVVSVGYAEYGHELVTLPRSTVEYRLEFVLDTIGHHNIGR